MESWSFGDACQVVSVVFTLTIMNLITVLSLIIKKRNPGTSMYVCSWERRGIALLCNIYFFNLLNSCLIFIMRRVLVKRHTIMRFLSHYSNKLLLLYWPVSICPLLEIFLIGNSISIFKADDHRHSYMQNRRIVGPWPSGVFWSTVQS